MQKNAALYDLTQNVQGAIFQAAFTAYLNNMSEEERNNRPQPAPIMQIRRGYAESPAWMMAQVAEFHPEPLTVDLFRRRAVYSAPRLTQAILELLASEKWLDRRGDAYYLTEAGQVILDHMTDNTVKPFVGFELIPAEDINRLESLLRRVIDASMESDDPPGTWCLAHSRHRAPGDDVPPLAKIIQYGSDLNAFRDDAHMAAYGAHDVSGRTWEAFNFVQSGKAKNAGELFDQLAYRGFTRDEWAASLGELAKRGWLVPVENGYVMTEAGQSVFDEVEQQTNAYFYAPWDCLSEEEFDELMSLLNEIQQACSL